MKISREHMERAEKILAAVYRGREIIQPDAAWRMGVMKQVRAIGLAGEGWADSAGLEKQVWRFAVATSLAALVMAVYIANAGFTPANKIVEVFMNYPAEFTLPQSFGF
ncbi:MAG: hypothetical protein JRI34_06250 [Deltaproteobacteria bacterium]|nr:hypothetical protein [Deltaproteobacteria bacterium]